MLVKPSRTLDFHTEDLPAVFGLFAAVLPKSPPDGGLLFPPFPNRLMLFVGGVNEDESGGERKEQKQSATLTCGSRVST